MFDSYTLLDFLYAVEKKVLIIIHRVKILENVETV